MNVWKTNKKAAVWAVLALVLTAALLTGCGAPQAGPSYHCTVSISCASILEHMELCSEEKRELVPEDGWILKPMTVTFYEGESVFNILQRTCKQQKIHMEFENTPIYNSAYIEGINARINPRINAPHSPIFPVLSRTTLGSPSQGVRSLQRECHLFSNLQRE